MSFWLHRTLGNTVGNINTRYLYQKKTAKKEEERKEEEEESALFCFVFWVVNKKKGNIYILYSLFFFIISFISHYDDGTRLLIRTGSILLYDLC